MVKTVISDYLSIEFIFIETGGHFEGICNAIYRGLFMFQKQPRECLEIGLELDINATEDLADFMCNFSRILLVLGASNITQWMVTLEGDSEIPCFISGFTYCIETQISGSICYREQKLQNA